MAGEDIDYIRFVRKQRCCVVECRSPLLIQAHHHTAGTLLPPESDTRSSRRGKGQRAHDAWAIPLCLKHHAQLHSLSGFFKGYTRLTLGEWQSAQVKALRAAYATG